MSQAQARGWQPVPVSIDTFDQEVVSEVAEALHIDRTRVACLPYADDQTVEEICAFHQRSLRQGGGYVITARTAVLRQLRGSLRVLNGSPVPSSIRAELHELVLRIRSEQAGAAGFAAGVFCVNRHGGPGDLERARMGLLQLLRATPELSDAWIENRGGAVSWSSDAVRCSSGSAATGSSSRCWSRPRSRSGWGWPPGSAWGPRHVPR